MNDPLKPHKHHNNTTVPQGDSSIVLELPDASVTISLTELTSKYPISVIPNYTYVTDHGVHGPYKLEGVSLRDLVANHYEGSWSELEVLSRDGFGNRISRDEALLKVDPIMLYFKLNDELLLEEHGLIRLVVPSEIDNALRQIKWVRTVRVK